GWFGTSELKSFDPASAEKAKMSLKKGSSLRTALSEALDPSLVPVLTPAAEADEYDDEEVDQETQPSRKKAATKTKRGPKARARSSNESDSDQPPQPKKRRPSTADEQPLKRKASKKSTAEEEDEIAKSKKRVSIPSRNRLESDLKSVDDDISITGAGNGRSKRSEEETGESIDHARAKKKIRSGQPNERLLKLRHKLQKLLLVEGLSDEAMIQNMERADPILSEVEAFEIDLQMLKDTKIGRLMKKISLLQFSQDQYRIVDRSVQLIRAYKSMMEKAQENGETASPAERTTDTQMTQDVSSTTTVTTTTTTSSSKVSEPQAASESSAPAPGASTLDSAPAPEAVVAAVAAIVETDNIANQQDFTVNVQAVAVEKEAPKEAEHPAIESAGV
ncbi:hypothetical protein BGW38_001174, partial [Lunasporangiospora selenospora]